MDGLAPSEVLGPPSLVVKMRFVASVVEPLQESWEYEPTVQDGDSNEVHGLMDVAFVAYE